MYVYEEQIVGLVDKRNVKEEFSINRKTLAEVEKITKSDSP